MLRFLMLLCVLLPAGPAWADPVIDAAFRTAQIALERARPHLGRETFGVEVSAVRDALSDRRFSSAYWGGRLDLRVVRSSTTQGACDNYAAFVGLPPENGVVTLTFCPEFFTPGTEGLRALTVLHEIVHAVAGPDECQAMAFAARVEYLAIDHYTPVERYWRANDCARSGFSLP